MSLILRGAVARPARNLSTRLLLTTAFCAVPAAAWAQQGPDAPASDSRSAAGQTASQDRVEEIVVTARRRDEASQRTPVAVTAVPALRIETSNLSRLSGLSEVAPNLAVTENPAASVGANFFIRGIGATSGSLYADPTVALYVDGVLIPHGGGAAFDLPDIARIEVLRGPQGTLFGRNTTGGAITLYTETPSTEFGGKLSGGYGSYNEKDFSLVVNSGALGNSGLSAKVTADAKARDGWATSPGRPRSRSGGYMQSHDWSAALHGDFAPGLTVDYRYDYAFQKNRPVWQVVAASPATYDYYSQSPSYGGAPFLISTDRLKTYYIDHRLPDSEVETYGHRLTARYVASPAFELKGILAYRKLNQDLSAQIAGSSELLGIVANPDDPSNPVEQVIPNETTFEPGRDRQYTAELQASGTLGDFSYVAGFYYFREHIDELLPSVITAVLAGGVGFQIDRWRQYDLRSTTLAGYGQVSYKPGALDGRLELTGGLRYTSDKKTENEQNYSSTGGLASLPDRTNRWNNTGFSGSVSFQWTPSIMTYARISSAYKAGGYNPGDLAPAYNPEKALSYEAGIKSEFLDHRVRFNLTGFHTTYRDLQISQYDGSNATNHIVNAGHATYDGFEAELVVVPGGGFQIDGNLGYVDPKYQEYLIKDTSGATVNVADVARFPYLAKWTGSVGLQYRSPPTPVGRVIARVDFSYRGTRYFHPLDQLQMFQEQVKSGPLHNLNASITVSDIPVGSSGIRMRAQLYGTNLLDQQYIVQGIDFGSLGLGVVSFAQPRSFGIRLTADF